MDYNTDKIKTKNLLERFTKIRMYYGIEDGRKKCYKIKLIHEKYCNVIQLDMSGNNNYEVYKMGKKRLALDARYSPKHLDFERYDPKALDLLMQCPNANRCKQTENKVRSLLYSRADKIDSLLN